MEFDYNKCPECGYVNDKRHDVCPSCGFNLKEYRNNFFEQQVKSLFETIMFFGDLFEETESEFIKKNNNNNAVLERKFGIENDNKTPETYQRCIESIDRTLKHIDEFKNVFELISNYKNCDKYISLLDASYKILNDFKNTQHKALVNLDKGVAQRVLNACVINGSFAIDPTLFDLYEFPSHITIPDGVTSIGSGAFAGCGNLTSVTIPDSVTSIGDKAFNGCSGLASVTIGSGVTSIGGGAFTGCDSLTSITIPDSVTSIGDWAFNNCSGLTSIVIPDSVTSIGQSAFSGCGSLTIINIPDSVTSIGWGAFGECSSLTSVTIPDSVTSIGDCAFNDCPIESATIPAFACPYIINDKLKNVKITSGKIIGNRAFYTCDSVTIGNGVKSIDCDALVIFGSKKSSVYYDGDIADWCNISFYNDDGKDVYNGIRHNDNYNFYIKENGEYKLVTDLIIPDTVKEIKKYAFIFCGNITSVTIPDSVTSIGGDAFAGCRNLTSIVIPDSVTSIGDYAFYYCTSLTSITIPDSVTSIGDCTFLNCTSLTSTTIGDGVTSIGDWAFYYCTSLTSIVIPDSVKSIGYLAFEGCSGLTSIVIPDSVTSIGDCAFYGCSGLTSVTIGSGVTSIGGGAFKDCPIESATMPAIACHYIKNDKLKTAVITSGDTIGYRAFEECSSLTSVTIPDSVTYIGESAFYGCSGLTSIVIPDSVTSIGYQAFYGCSSLTSIIFNGTKAGWKWRMMWKWRMRRSDWLYGVPVSCKVYCKNGIVSI